MKKLKPERVRELIGYCEAGELDRVVGVLVRLSTEELAELKALIWLGRDGHTPKHWEALVIQARAKLDKDTVQFLAEEKDLDKNLTKGLESMENAGRI
ncbi:MAG TPA: DUF3775 domain-containing protein [Gammaproteobacteria bacterium]|nr:DUF3775 domain-containing protein [Gammaproteobacteria bacterium]